LTWTAEGDIRGRNQDDVKLLFAFGFFFFLRFFSLFAAISSSAIGVCR
jgi:hypothetical protein